MLFKNIFKNLFKINRIWPEEEILTAIDKVNVLDNRNIPLSPELSEKDVSNLKEAQKKMLKMMKVLHDICEKYEIRYFLGGGSVLGAVLYNGWIPWDGDIDIEVHEEDFDKLRSIAHKELPSDMWFQDKKTDKYYTSRDINAKIRDLYSCYTGYTEKGNTDWHNGLQIDIEKFYFKKNKLVEFYLKKSSRLVYKDVFPLRKMKFEDAEFYVMNNPIKYLNRRYGKNWHKVPAIKTRKPHEGLVDPFKTCEFHYEKYPYLYKQKRP